MTATTVMLHIRFIITIFLFLGAVCMMHTSAQTGSPYFIEKLTTEQGLSSNRVNDMVQDDKGFLWIATSDGLNRFDGTEVTQYFYQDKTNSLPHNYVYCLKKLPDNYLAIGTQSGLSFYNGNNGMFENFYYTLNNTLDEYNNTIIELELDTHGNLWATSKNSIYVYDEHRKLKKTFSSPFSESEVARRRGNFAEKMMPLPDGRILLCLYDGWYTATADAATFTKIENLPDKERFRFINEVSPLPVGPKEEQYISPAHIFKIYNRYFLCIKRDTDSLLLLDEQGRQLSACFFPYNKYPYVLWSQQVCVIDSSKVFFLFHNYGLGIISVEWKQGKPVIHSPSGLLFESSEYDNALCDRQGNWWLATTEGGLQKISPSKQYFKSAGLIDQQTGKHALYEVNYIARYGNRLWMSTYGNGFFEVDCLSGKQKQFRLSDTYHDTWTDFIWNIREVTADTLWIGTQAGMFWYRLSTGRSGRLPAYPGKPAILDSVAITTQFVSSDGLVWIGLGRGKGLCYFDPVQKRFTYFPGSSSQGYPLRYPLVIAEDTKGDLWFANDASTMLVRRSRITKQFQTIGLPAELRKKISSLYGLSCEGDSVLWLGTVTSGLIRFSIATNKAELYGHERGLLNSHIGSIYEDKNKKLWLATQGGLSVFDQQTKTFSNYAEKDGLPVKYLTAFFYYDSLSQFLYSGGHGTSVWFTPAGMSWLKKSQQTIITAMRVNGKPYMLVADEPIRFGPQQNDITIQYTAIDLVNGPETNYAYKLIGEDTNWVMAGHQRQINFSRLAPGHYTFIVRSGTSDEVGQEASIQFYIRPPFTKTKWFYASLLIPMGGLFYGLYRFQLRQLARTEQVRSEISRNLHDEVGSTLTNISLGSLLAQKHLQNTNTVNYLLERIYQDSQTVSQNMREIVWSINPKIDTLEEALPRMLQYASESLEAKSIELEAEIDPGIERIKLNMRERRDLYLIFKEAVNNLARHSDARHAGVRFHLDNTILLMTIRDDGHGFDKSMHTTSNGLRNMQERAGEHQWQLTIESAPGKGTILLLKVAIA